MQCARKADDLLVDWHHHLRLEKWHRLQTDKRKAFSNTLSRSSKRRQSSAAWCRQQDCAFKQRLAPCSPKILSSKITRGRCSCQLFHDFAATAWCFLGCLFKLLLPFVLPISESDNYAKPMRPCQRACWFNHNCADALHHRDHPFFYIIKAAFLWATDWNHWNLQNFCMNDRVLKCLPLPLPT